MSRRWPFSSKSTIERSAVATASLAPFGDQSSAAILAAPSLIWPSASANTALRQTFYIAELYIITRDKVFIAEESALIPDPISCLINTIGDNFPAQLVGNI